VSHEAGHWLAEQEVALLETIYQLQSPPERDERRQPTLLEAQKARASKSRRPSDPSQANGAITG
jgi:hypothetical protein